MVIPKVPLSLVELPIDRYLPEVRAAVVDRAQDVILMSSTGSGKTTRVPADLARILTAKNRGKTYVLEPRRLAARLSAERVADEQGWEIGREVGYQFRYERRRDTRTPLVFLTEGTFTRELLTNPTLDGVALVVLDEFHERHLQGDLALALLRRLQETVRPDLRIVVMSATLEKEALRGFLPLAHVLEVEAPRFPIEVEYAPLQRDLASHIRNVVLDVLRRPDARDFGDLLIFLPGMAEIRRVEQALRECSLPREVDVIPLHGELAKEEQARAFARAGTRKIILSTNIAESSLTIPGVNTVIDAGLARVASFSYWTGLPSLTTKNISRASAIQRAGRAGRTGPGRVIRLYAKGDFEGRAHQEVAEIQRADLMGPALELTELLGDARDELKFFEAPERLKWNSALEALGRIAALSENLRDLTPIGRELLKLPLHPRLGRVVLEAAKSDAVTRVLPVIAALSEGVDLGIDAEEGSRRIGQDPDVARFLRRLQSLALPRSASKRVTSKPQATGLETLLLTGFPDRVGKKRGGELVLSQGGSVRRPEHEVFAAHEFFLVLDVRELRGAQDVTSRLELKSVWPLDELQLFDLDPPQVQELKRWEWSHPKKRWLRYEILTYQKLELSSKVEDAALDGDDLEADRLRRHVYREWRKENTEARDLIRLGLAGHSDPEEFLFTKVRELFPDALGVSELPDWSGLFQLLPDEDRRRLEKAVPKEVRLAGRRTVPIVYEPGQPPYVESRIQDFFGMKVGPTYLDGQKKLALHLLAPNGRAVQITEDLEGFWKNHYPSIRKELMRRYPRHQWPEDPLTATPPEPYSGRRSS